MENLLQMPEDIWCNPLPLENYPVGFLAPGRYEYSTSSSSGFMGPRRDFREMADPEVLYDEGKWYMFPSVGEAYVSCDLAHWEHHNIQFANGERLGYAPTIAKCRGKYLLSSSWPFARKAEILMADSPLGPYRSLGTPVDGEGIPLGPEWLDPMLFADDDGKLYAYWYYGGAGEGVFGIELEADNPVQGIGKPVKLFDFDPQNRFERFGEFNEHRDLAWIEGESMFKHDGEYYLQYSGCGTQFRAYCVGVYRGKSPLGPFTVQRTPVARNTTGRVCGTGHGCWCAGPDGNVWQFYTTIVRRIHMFERRIGMDRVMFDAQGNAQVQITAVPQSVKLGDLGLLPVSVNKDASASSVTGCCYPSFAVDDCTHTWWMPDKDDAEPYLQVVLRQDFEISGFQISWAEEGIDVKNGVLPEAVKYKVEFLSDDGSQVLSAADFTGNEKDLLVDFRMIAPVRAKVVRLSFRKAADRRLMRGVNNFTLFGKR